jgi:hypothetical protein
MIEEEEDMTEQLPIDWVMPGEEPPPTNRRLLLIFSAAGEPPDAQLMGMSEVVIGFWTGDHFRVMTPEYPHSFTVKPTHWATLRLPREVRLQPRSEFREDILE